MVHVSRGLELGERREGERVYEKRYSHTID
jgi:hypothetical protein